MRRGMSRVRGGGCHPCRCPTGVYELRGGTMKGASRAINSFHHFEDRLIHHIDRKGGQHGRAVRQQRQTRYLAPQGGVRESRRVNEGISESSRRTGDSSSPVDGVPRGEEGR